MTSPSPTSAAAAPSPPGDLLGRRGPAGAQVGADDQRRAVGLEGRAQGADAGADGPAGVHGQHARVQPEGGVDGRGVGLVQVGRGRRGEPEPVDRDVRRALQGQPAGLDAHRRRVLVVGGHRAGALAPTLAQHTSDVAPLEAVVGDVARHAQESSHRPAGYRRSPIHPEAVSRGRPPARRSTPGPAPRRPRRRAPDAPCARRSSTTSTMRLTDSKPGPSGATLDHPPRSSPTRAEQCGRGDVGQRIGHRFGQGAVALEALGEPDLAVAHRPVVDGAERRRHQLGDRRPSHAGRRPG